MRHEPAAPAPPMAPFHAGKAAGRASLMPWNPRLLTAGRGPADRRLPDQFPVRRRLRAPTPMPHSASDAGRADRGCAPAPEPAPEPRPELPMPQPVPLPIPKRRPGLPAAAAEGRRCAPHLHGAAAGRRCPGKPTFPWSSPSIEVPDNGTPSGRPGDPPDPRWRPAAIRRRLTSLQHSRSRCVNAPTVGPDAEAKREGLDAPRPARLSWRSPSPTRC